MFRKKSDTTIDYPEVHTGVAREEAQATSLDSYQTSDPIENPDAEGAMPSDLGLESDETLQQQDGCERCSDPQAQWLEFMTVASFLLITRHRRFSHYLCLQCAKKQGLSALTSSAILGWWGIPWGLFTLIAIWVNTKSLLVGSSLSKARVGGAALAALAVPTALVAILITTDTGSGDQVSQATLDLLQEGHTAYYEGDMEKAAELYSKAARMEPDEGIIKMYQASAQARIDQLGQALANAIMADRMTSGRSDAVGLRGWILSEMGNEPAAREQYARIRGATLIDDYDAEWIEALPMEFSDWQELLRVTKWARNLNSTDPFYRATEILSLAGLGRLEEADAVAMNLDEEASDYYLVRQALVVLEMRKVPAEGARLMTENWDDYEFGNRSMEWLVEAAEQGGGLDEVQTTVRKWLFEGSAPASAWLASSHWFKEQHEWRKLVESYNNQRAELAPISSEFRLLHPVLDRKRVAELGARASTLDHPYAVELGAIGLRAELYDTPRRNWLPKIDRFLQQHPAFVPMELYRATVIANQDVDQATKVLDLIRQQDDLTPQSRSALDLYQARFLLFANQADEAEQLAASIDPELLPDWTDSTDVSLLISEIALSRGDPEAARAFLDPLLTEDNAPATAVILGWVADILNGHAPNCEQDLDSWQSRQDDSIASDPTSTTQALLLENGAVTEEWALQATANIYPSTFRFVRLLVDASAQQGRIDKERLLAIAADNYPRDLAPRLARLLSQSERSI